MHNLENKLKKELLFRLTRKDFVIEAVRGSGNGGQNRNVTNSKCRITHPLSGASAQAQDERSYKQNEALAFRRLIETQKFKTWHRIETARRMGLLRDIDRTVAEEMKKIKIEVRINGRWVDENKAAN